MKDEINKINNLTKLIDNLKFININYEYLINNLNKAQDYLNNNIISGKPIDDEIILNVINDCNKVKDDVVNIKNQCNNKINIIQKGEDYG